MARVKLTPIDNYLKKLREIADDLPEAAHEQFVKNTPVKTGRARRSTRLQNNTIVADYPYSPKLEEGSSKQAPKGMIEPTVAWIQQEVERRIKGI